MHHRCIWGKENLENLLKKNVSQMKILMKMIVNQNQMMMIDAYCKMKFLKNLKMSFQLNKIQTKNNNKDNYN